MMSKKTIRIITIAIAIVMVVTTLTMAIAYIYKISDDTQQGRVK